MTLTVGAFDALPAEAAADLLRACCGASRWVSSMVDRRPFGSVDALLAAADEIWWSLDEADWREAFSHHPRIGEQTSAAGSSERARSWSSSEQAGVATAQDTVRDSLLAANREYEKRFGFIYIVCATGKTATEMLTLARQRLGNAKDVELRVAAEEQRKITRLRLQKLFAEETTA